MTPWPLILALGRAAGPAPSEAPAAAQPQQDAARVVVLVPAKHDGRIDDVVASLRAGVPSEEIEVLTVELEGPTTVGARVVEAQNAAARLDARAVFWIDLSNDAEYLVYLYDRDRSAVLRRRVPEAAQSPEAAVETMWLIVRSGALAIVAGGDLAMEALDPEQIAAEVKAADPAPPPARAPGPGLRGSSEHRPPDLLGLWLSLGYLGGGIASTLPWQSGAAIELDYAAHRRVKVGLQYGVLGGRPVRDPAELRLVRHELAAVLSVGGPVATRLRVEGRVLPAVELAQWRTATAAGVRVVGKAAAELALRVWLIPRLTFDIAGGAAVAFNDFDFIRCDPRAETCTGSARQVVLSPWRVRPRARLGFSLVF